MKFNVGDWVIDTNRRTVPTVRGIIHDSCPNLYVLEDDCNYYIECEDCLREYDKYWFDRSE